MITICAALEAEVSSFKARFNMKKIASDLYYSEGDDIRLLITGIGPMRAAISIAALFGADKDRDLSNDILINIGSCGAECIDNSVVGEIYRINKIKDAISNKSYYPDMIINTGFKEAEIVSDNKIFRYDEKTETLSEGTVVLHDEEASGVYLAATRFLKQHNILFLKVVSDDSITRGDITLEKIIDIMDKSKDRLFQCIDDIKTIRDQVYQWDESIEPDKELLEKFFKECHASVTMQNEFMQYYRYAKLEGISVEDIIKNQYEKGKIPCKDKVAGKKVMKEIGENIISR